MIHYILLSLFQYDYADNSAPWHKKNQRATLTEHFNSNTKTE